MNNSPNYETILVQDTSSWVKALSVVQQTYCHEKNWVDAPEDVFPESDLKNPYIAWFLVVRKKEPVGILRIHFAPPLGLYKEYGFTMFQENLDVERFIMENQIAEIGRFAVVPRHRKRIRIVLALIKAASQETVKRNYTHYITDIFEGEVNSPYNFHTRIIGFEPIASHEVGEMNCRHRRITLILNIRDAYNRIRLKNNRFYRFLTEGWDAIMHERMMLT